MTAVWRRGLMVLVVLSLVVGCSSDRDKKEKTVLEKKQEQVAKEAVERIKVPLDQAKATAEKQNDYGRQLEEQQKK